MILKEEYRSETDMETLKTDSEYDKEKTSWRKQLLSSLFWNNWLIIRGKVIYSPQTYETENSRAKHTLL